MWSQECKHQMLMDDTRRTTTHDRQPLTTIANNSTWSILIQYIRIKLSGDNLT